MRLVEFEAKKLLRDAGLPVPDSWLWTAAPHAIAPRIVVKAQTLAGGRGKRGLIRTATPTTLAAEIAIVQSKLADPATPILIEDHVETTTEYYLAWRIDDLRQAPVLMVSPHGGINIEDHPDSTREHHADPLRPLGPADLIAFFRDCGANPNHLGALARFAATAYRLFVTEDLTLLEINPLGGTAANTVIAMDAKIVVDDAALARHGGWKTSLSETLEAADQLDIERRAAASGLTFVDLSGNIALFTSGAGLGMALIDLLADAGMQAANFVDASGGSSGNVFNSIGELVFERARRPDVEAILMFFTLTATSLQTVVQSLLNTLDATPPPKPLIIGLVAAGAAERDMTLAEARSAFAERGYETVGELADAVAAIKRLVAKL